MNSIWNDNVKKYNFNSLEGDIKTDVLVIGGGMCGLLCAYMLKNAGVDCALAEQNEILSGVTEGTTAKITFQHGLIYDKILKKYGFESARLYYESQKSAFEKLKSIASGTDCDLKESDSLVYSLTGREIIENEAKALEALGCKTEVCEKTELPFKIKGAVKVFNQAHFNPLKFGYAIAKDLNIYENTKIKELNPHMAITDKGNIRAEKIIVATHFPFINKHGAYFMKMYQDRSYVLALENANEIKDMYVDGAKDGLSFRNYNGLLLLGGGSHRTGKMGGGWAELERVKEKYYPEARIVKKWATQDCMTLDGISYIGSYSKHTPDLYTATGFNKWGMTSSMLSAMMLKDIITKEKSEYKKLYSPSRSMLHSQLAINIFDSFVGIITPKTPRCTHMGCALKYNKAEHSWDCSCHGSRFDEKGRVINNPATEDKTDF